MLSCYLHKQNCGAGIMIIHSPSLILQRVSQSPSFDLESNSLLTFFSTVFNYEIESVSTSFCPLLFRPHIFLIHSIFQIIMD